jgi:uncharacterized protein YdhG (YjbR/CyaY superfamily)
MASSRATTVAKYLAELPPERRKVVAAVRKMVLEHLPEGYQETMGWGMISYGIPLSVYPETYNGQPLCYAAIAAQKSHFALYLMGAYADSKQYKALERAFARAGKRMDMGKSCLRFKQIDDLPMAAIGKVIAGTPPKKYIAIYEANRPNK